MGLGDFLSTVGQAIAERARSKEFGPDYRQRWQRYEDEHVRSQVENAISNAQLQDQTLQRSAKIRAAFINHPEAMSPSEALAKENVDEQNLKDAYTKALTQNVATQPEHRLALEQLQHEANMARVEIANARNETERARAEGTLQVAMARLGEAQARLGQAFPNYSPTGQLLGVANAPRMAGGQWNYSPIPTQGAQPSDMPDFSDVNAGGSGRTVTSPVAPPPAATQGGGFPTINTTKPGATQFMSKTLTVNGKPTIASYNRATGGYMDSAGNPITGDIAPQRGSVVENRLDSAQAVYQTGEDLIRQLRDPAFASQVGPIMGRYNTLQDFVGNPPPEFAKLAGQIESYSLANMGVHGMRSSQGAEMIKNMLQGRGTPEALIAKIQGLNEFSRHYMENEGVQVPGAAPSPSPSPGLSPADAYLAKLGH